MTSSALTTEISRPTWAICCFYMALPSLSMLDRLMEVLIQRTGITDRLFISVTIAASQLCYVLVLLIPGRILAAKLINAVGQYQGIRLWISFILTLILLIGLFMIAYPWLDAGRLGFASDRDEALDIATHALLAGEYPYHCHAVVGIHHGCPETGNPITPLPGALLLAIPFVSLGFSAYQNFFWLAAWLVTTLWIFTRPGLSIAYLWVLLLSSPIMLAELITGGDLIANSLAVTVFVVALLPGKPWSWRVLLLAAGLGIALSYRVHFLLMLAPLSIYWGRFWGWRQGLAVLGVVLGGFAIVTMPFYLHHPVDFSPLAAQQKLSIFNSILPYASWTAVATSVVVGTVMGFYARQTEFLLHACAMVVLIPVLFAVVLNSIVATQLTFSVYGWYAMSGMFLGTLAVWITLFNPAGITQKMVIKAPGRRE